jgi:chitinase
VKFLCDLQQDYAIRLWLNGGTPKEKLIVGMGLYGRSFKMATGDHDIGKPAAGAGTAGTVTREAGFLILNKIQSYITDKILAILSTSI